MNTIADLELPSTEAVALAERQAARLRLERMFNDHHAFIWRLLRRLGLNRGGADDAAQQVFLVAAERIVDIQDGRERAFLFGTALRVARSTSRNQQRWVLEDDMDARNGGLPRPEDLADQRRAVDLMSRILATLQHDLATVFILAELEGQTMPEVSSLLEIPLGTATSRLRRAREAFRAAVAAFEAASSGGVKS